MQLRLYYKAVIMTEDQVDLTYDVYFYQQCRRLKTTRRKHAVVSKLRMSLVAGKRIHKLYIYIYIYRMSRGNVPDFGRMFLTLKYTDITQNTYVYPKLNGYGDNGERKVWSSCDSTYCTCFAYCYSYTAHVRTSVSQPRQAHSAFIINRCHSYSEL